LYGRRKKTEARGNDANVEKKDSMFDLSVAFVYLLQTVRFVVGY